MSPRRNESSHRIVICGSMSFFAEMQMLREELSRMRIPAVAPPLESIELEMSNSEQARRTKFFLSRRHIRRIRDTSTHGILVCNRDCHGVANYIGPNTFAEIAVAFAHYKSIYLLQDVAEVYAEELMAWKAIPLRGDLGTLVKKRQAVSQRPKQLRLFDT